MEIERLYQSLIENHDRLLKKIEADFGVEPILEQIHANWIFYDFCNIEQYKTYSSNIQNKTREVLQSNYNQEVVSKLLIIKNERISRHVEYLSESTLPTTLNMIFILFDNVLNDFRRNLINE